MPRCPKWPLSFRFPHQNPEYIFLPPNTFSVTRQSLSPWSNNIWQGVQIVTLYNVEGIYFIKLKWPHIFHYKGLPSYPVLRKWQYHIPNRVTKLSAVKAISCWYVLENFSKFHVICEQKAEKFHFTKIQVCINPFACWRISNSSLCSFLQLPVPSAFLDSQ
jgi:hypothetical protein